MPNYDELLTFFQNKKLFKKKYKKNNKYKNIKLFFIVFHFTTIKKKR